MVVVALLFPADIPSSAIVPLPTNLGLENYNSVDDLAVHIWVKGIDSTHSVINLARFRHLVNPNSTNSDQFYIFFASQDNIFSPLNMCISRLSSLHNNHRGDILVVKIDVRGHPSDIQLQEVSAIGALVLKSVYI